MAFRKSISMPDFKIGKTKKEIKKMPQKKKLVNCCDCIGVGHQDMNEKKKPETVMYEYIRDSETKEKIGLFYSDMIEGQISIGFSVVHKPDVFNFERGMKIAIGRAISYVNKHFEKPIEDRKRVFIPSTVYSQFIKYIERCKKYYKNETFCEWINNGYYLKVDLSNG